MSEEKMTASLSIDAKYVEEEVSRIVKAAIVSALGNRDEIIRKAIDRTIDTYVDRDGNPCRKDFARSIGKLVEIRTYRPIEKQKEFCGELTAYDNNSVTIDEEGTPRTFDKKDIALVRLAIDF